MTIKMAQKLRVWATSATVTGMLLGGFATPASAATIIYTFEAPLFTVAQTTPLLNRTPNVGDPTFETDFTSSPAANGFLVTPVPLNPLFSGQSLQEPSINPTADILTLLFSDPIFSFQVDFALNQAPTGPAGRFDLITPVGSTSAAGGNVGPLFQGGTLFFSSATPFTTAQLLAFASTGARVEFAIDDLVLNTTAVPEPASLLILGGGMIGMGVRRYRRRA